MGTPWVSTQERERVTSLKVRVPTQRQQLTQELEGKPISWDEGEGIGR